ncbi:MAG: hypothetical protein MUD17_13730 [Gemmatimonadaceae bacterium]|nr:hypothetical protein [Gemmatimonadaceae bacterium]
MQPDAAHDAIHEERGACHVPRVFEDADEQEQHADLRHEDQHTANTREDAVHHK